VFSVRFWSALAAMIESGPIPAIHGVVRGAKSKRTDPRRQDAGLDIVQASSAISNDYQRLLTVQIALEKHFEPSLLIATSHYLAWEVILSIKAKLNSDSEPPAYARQTAE
jgi:hypothetical protein